MGRASPEASLQILDDGECDDIVATCDPKAVISFFLLHIYMVLAESKSFKSLAPGLLTLSLCRWC